MITTLHGPSRRREQSSVIARLGAAGLAVLVLSGCSFDVGSLSEQPDEIVTGSIKPPPDGRLSPDLGPEDWRRARSALAVALDLQGNGLGVKWENPESKLHGEITPAGAPFVRNDEICRRFAATIVKPGGKVAGRSGQACKLSAQEWQIRSVQSAGR